MQTDKHCNNCGKNGHMFHQCKLPIISIGIIAFRMRNAVPEYLMIRRKDTFGYIDYMRGKYAINDHDYLKNMLNQMTLDEKHRLLTVDFNVLWFELWGKVNVSKQYKSEEVNAHDKHQTLLKQRFPYSLSELIDESNKTHNWSETEWGFPKGRRNHKETDYECAMREFNEETGYDTHHLRNLQNVMPYEEIFTGTNFKSYKHKYFVMYMEWDTSEKPTSSVDKTEVSKIEWKTFESGMDSIRPYNVEKKNLFINVHKCVTHNVLL